MGNTVKADLRLELQGLNALRKGGNLISSKPDDASRIIKGGLLVHPLEGAGWHNLGLSLHMSGFIHEAVRAYKHAIFTSDGTIDESINNLGQDLLLLGRWEEGWEYYEQRLKRPQSQEAFGVFFNNFGKPWTGFTETRDFQKLIVVSEQGFGDTFQFSRFCKDLTKFNKEVELFCQEAVVGVLRDSENICTISTVIGSDPRSTLWCPLMSLPHRLNITPFNIPHSSGYLHASDAKVKLWKERLKRKHNHLLVGLHWQGNPRFERKLYSRGRSMPFKNFEVLSDLEDVEFVSIQKGRARDQADFRCGLNFVSGQEEFDKSLDFRDTAAVLSNCDVLISADSGVVHLAGALGVATGLLLSYIPEWRWGLNSHETPWYDSVKLFRQSSQDEWGPVMDQIKIFIRTCVQRKHGGSF